MGLALLIFVLKTIALRTGEERWNRAARFWARIFGISFALGVVTGIPMEFQFGTNCAVFEGSGRRDRANAGDGRRVLVFSGVFFSGVVSIRREALGPARTLVQLADDVRRLVAIRLSHRRDGRMDAAPGRIRDRAERLVPTAKLLAFAAQPLGAVAVRAHDDGRGSDGMLHDGCDRRLLPAFRSPRRIRKYLRARRSDCRSTRRHLAAFPDR